MQVKIARWGNSVAMRLPREIVDKLGWTEGSMVEVEAEGGGLRASAVKRRRFHPDVPTLEEMVEEMRRLGPENEPETVDWGPDRGSEIIEDEYSRGEITYDDLMRRKST